jgi:hypothetical protein
LELVGKDDICPTVRATVQSLTPRMKVMRIKAMGRPETQTDRLLMVTSQLAMEGMLLGLGLEMEPQIQPLPPRLKRRSRKNARPRLGRCSCRWWPCGGR